ncbi:hypothetical protein CCHR01_05606 [Colletotrichum chrysophilum]|uniref:Uncharacterized protein n=1 Tax=Colletotrichum chrysophilum TaxID=1836956 RepID=A0AAD9ATZ8_9PEZI|nr:hypothetical protein CCHR01_05606 [Colletotrichum chrysophilum]
MPPPMPAIVDRKYRYTWAVMLAAGHQT